MKSVKRLEKRYDMFGHEKLLVYKRSLEFVTMRRELLGHITRRVIACDHLERASESILLNIAHASSSWSPKERIVYIGHANGSALECAACLDIFVAKDLLEIGDVHADKSKLREIVNMLITMKKESSSRINEENTIEYSTKHDKFFSHESLDVYRTALLFTDWVESVARDLSCSSDLHSKLDKSSTGIVLNIAEGNGRFSKNDQIKFLRISYKAVIQSSSLVDLAIIDDSSNVKINDGQKMLRQIAAMLISLSKKVPSCK